MQLNYYSIIFSQLTYFLIFSFSARVPEFASKHESKQKESALRLALLRP